MRFHAEDKKKKKKREGIKFVIRLEKKSCSFDESDIEPNTV